MQSGIIVENTDNKWSVKKWTSGYPYGYKEIVVQEGIVDLAGAFRQVESKNRKDILIKDHLHTNAYNYFRKIYYRISLSDWRRD